MKLNFLDITKLKKMKNVKISFHLLTNKYIQNLIIEEFQRLLLLQDLITKNIPLDLNFLNIIYLIYKILKISLMDNSLYHNIEQ